MDAMILRSAARVFAVFISPFLAGLNLTYTSGSYAEIKQLKDALAAYSGAHADIVQVTQSMLMQTTGTDILPFTGTGSAQLMGSDSTFVRKVVFAVGASAMLWTFASLLSNAVDQAVEAGSGVDVDSDEHSHEFSNSDESIKSDKESTSHAKDSDEISRRDMYDSIQSSTCDDSCATMLTDSAIQNVAPSCCERGGMSRGGGDLYGFH